MSEIDHTRWNEDLAAHMLGALEADEAAALERHAEDCERCRAEMRWLTPAVQAISESPERVEPPPELRSRVMAEVRADAAERTGTAAAGAEAAPFQRASRWLRNLGSGPMGLRPVAGVGAAVLVVAAIAGYAIGGGIGGDPDGGGTNTVISGQPSGITAEMVDEGDGGALRLENVERLPSDRVLQAWVQRDGEVEPVRALFEPDREGSADTELPEMSGVEVVMVTVEPRGGSDAPTSKPIVTIPVPQ